MAEEHDVAWILARSPDIRARYEEGAHIINYEEIRKSALHRAQELRKSLLSTLALVATAACGGFIVGVYVIAPHHPSSRVASIVQAVAAGLLLWATLWQLNWGIRSVGGESLPEPVHGWLFNGLYLLGTLLFFLFYGWQA